jgi:hypothetical protein
MPTTTEISLPDAWGFRSGQKGVHNTRTVMFSDLETLLDALPPRASKEDYREAVVDENLLAKNTDSTRRYTAKRLSELYGLDPEITLFRTFRQYWDVASEEGRPLLAMLLALARDPILRLTAEPVLGMGMGEQFDKTVLQEVIVAETGDRFSETSIKKISRMTGSSWTQSGHLKGRYNKSRQRPNCTPENTAYALLLGYLSGVRGTLLFDTFWTKVLDAPDHEVHERAKAASRRSLLTYRNAGGIVEVDFSMILSEDEQERIREQS